MNTDLFPEDTDPAYDEANSAIGYTSHELKTWPEQFEAVRKGAKRAELRLNDRNFRVGDHLLLREWDPATEAYTGRDQWTWVLHLVHGPGFGLAEGYVMMSLDLLPF